MRKTSKKSKKGYLEKIFFQWDTTTFNEKSKNDKILITTIDSSPHKVSFDVQSDKEFCTSISNWQNKLYKANVRVIFTPDKIVGYQILSVFKDLDNDVIDIE